MSQWQYMYVYVEQCQKYITIVSIILFHCLTSSLASLLYKNCLILYHVLFLCSNVVKFASQLPVPLIDIVKLLPIHLEKVKI